MEITVLTCKKLHLPFVWLSFSGERAERAERQAGVWRMAAQQEVEIANF